MHARIGSYLLRSARTLWAWPPTRVVSRALGLSGTLCGSVAHSRLSCTLWVCLTHPGVALKTLGPSRSLVVRLTSSSHYGRLTLRSSLTLSGLLPLFSGSLATSPVISCAPGPVCTHAKFSLRSLRLTSALSSSSCILVPSCALFLRLCAVCYNPYPRGLSYSILACYRYTLLYPLIRRPVLSRLAWFS